MHLHIHDLYLLGCRYGEFFLCCDSGHNEFCRLQVFTSEVVYGQTKHTI